MTSEASRRPVRPPFGDPRLPPGQRLTDGWPVLTYGGVPHIDLATWEFKIFGLVEREVTLNWEQFMALPQTTDVSDIHCVTTWSRYDNEWQGVRFRDVLGLAKPLPDAKHVMFHSYGGYTTNVPLEELMGDEALFAHTHDGRPIEPEHGGPLRGIVPKLYFWKSAKWVRGIELLPDDRPGFWEMYGYHGPLDRGALRLMQCLSGSRGSPLRTCDELAAVFTYVDGTPSMRDLTPDAMAYMNEWMLAWHAAMWPLGRRNRGRDRA